MLDDVYIYRDNGTIHVYAFEDYRNGDLETEVPSVAITVDQRHNSTLLLTWKEADALQAALNKVVSIARHG